MEQVEHLHIYICIEMTYVKTPLGRPKLIWENNMKVGLIEMGSEDMNWTGFGLCDYSDKLSGSISNNLLCSCITVICYRIVHMAMSIWQS
jgi:hypothetical protein